MVSTRQMSTSLSNSIGGNNGSEVESVQRLTVITRQAASNGNAMAMSVNGSASTSRAAAPTYNLQQQQQQGHTSRPIHVPVAQSIFLLDLPVEILDKIFSYVGYKKVGQIRVVSHKMNDVCMAVLNSTFSKLITQMLNRFQNVKAKMPRRESARRNHPLACECDIIETCYMRLSLLQMSFGKHIERKHCCFFPGGILDEVYNVLNYIRNTPRLEKPFRVTDELHDLSTMAMEYFKDHIEPNLPDIAYFSSDFFEISTTRRPSSSSLKISSELSDSSSSLPSPPQSNMVLRKGIRKIKQGMKMYNNQLSVLRNELRTCKRKSSEQGKQIAEQQKLLAEQQKQTLEYANRLDENDKKNEEMARKFSTLLQELNKCKTELQYWRSKSPATPMCTSCGQKITPIVPPEDFQVLINQGVKPEDIIPEMDDTDESETSSVSLNTDFVFPDEATTAKLMAVNSASRNLKRQHGNNSNKNNGSGNNINTSSSSGNQTQYNISIEPINNIPQRIKTDGKKGTLQSSTSLITNTNDLNLDIQNNINVCFSTNENLGLNVTDNRTIGNGKNMNGTTGYPVGLFYGTSDKGNSPKGEADSPVSSISDNNANVVDEHYANPQAGTGDTTSLSLVASNETKKARKVQKASRCYNLKRK